MPRKDEERGSGTGRPIMPNFIRSSQPPRPSTPAPPEERGPDVVDASGTPYVEAE